MSPATSTGAVRDVLERLTAVRQTPTGWMARCPAHADDTPSLSVGLGEDGRVLLRCFAGCQIDEIVRSLGIGFGGLYRASGSTFIQANQNRRPRYTRTWPEPDPKWEAIAKLAHSRAFSRNKLGMLARTLGVTEASLVDLRVGWIDANGSKAAGSPISQSAWTFPERNGRGDVVGVVFRYADGSKLSGKGAKRGLSIPRTLLDKTINEQPIYVVEGASCTAAILSHGGAAVGRDTCYSRMAVEYLVSFLGNRSGKVIVVGENDRKDDGSWPGKNGAKRTASELAERLQQPVSTAMPPEGFKDMRAYLSASEAVK